MLKLNPRCRFFSNEEGKKGRRDFMACFFTSLIRLGGSLPESSTYLLRRVKIEKPNSQFQAKKLAPHRSA